MSTCTVVIVAAGRGERAGASGKGPKQYRIIGGQTVLNRAISAFIQHGGVDNILVVTHPDDDKLYAESSIVHEKLLAPVHGGATRQESVWRGLLELVDIAPDKVLIHDAARPFVSADTISNVIAATRPGICALPAHPVSDTLKHADSDGFVDRTLERSGLFCAQTPQGFEYDAILQAHETAHSSGISGFTDDAQIGEWAGMRIRIVDSPSSNFKITTADDLERANMLYAVADIRTGNGYDVHRLVEGKSITLCGVEISHDRKLDGHSDADVGLHALTDALLGTIADGDIGSHFPPNEPRWKGMSSDRFLKYAVELVNTAGGTITHMDVTLVCESPRIGPHRDSMRQRISDITGTCISRISVKATTSERIGFIGRQEGIAALATATVSFAGIDAEGQDGN